MLILVKPQFELERKLVGPGGVVLQDELRWQAVAQVRKTAELLHWETLAHAESEVHGPAGNREIFVQLHRQPSPL